MAGDTDQINEILTRAEKEVLALVSAAAEEGDYALLDRAREIAGRLSGLRLEVSSAAINTGSASADNRAGLANSKPPARRTANRTKRGKPSEYPKFLVGDGCLYKVAWSKKKKKEYSHRSPLPTVARVLDLLERLDGGPEPLTAEQCLVRAAAQDIPIPGYQFYLILSTLKHLDVARPVGREGFILNPGWRERADEYLSSSTTANGPGLS